MQGQKHSEEARKKMSESHQGPRPWRIGKGHSEEARMKMSISHAGIPLSEKAKINLGIASKRAWAAKSEVQRQAVLSKRHAAWGGNKSPMKGKHHTEEANRKNSDAHKGKRLSPKTEFTSDLLKGRYQDPAYVQKMAKAWNIKPNKPESCLNNLLEGLYPGQWKYTGDFSFTINGKCPDFVNCNGQKKIIELFGDYWHRGQNPQDRIDTFRPFGYETLVIWEHELKNIDSVIERIRGFMGA